MGNRLTKIYTRKGDDGSTGLADGSRVSKDDAQVEVIGELDELNCCLGLVLASELSDDIKSLLTDIQHKLFDLGAVASGVKCHPVASTDIEQLEQQIDLWNSELPPLKEFILPGGSFASAHCHLARAVCRRLERHIVGWCQANAVFDTNALAYINRLSDVLFVLCRILMRQDGALEAQWKKDL